MPVSGRVLKTPIRISAAHKHGENVDPFPDELQAVWDTGAQTSLISNDIANHLNLPIIGQQVMKGIGGPCLSPEYLAGLILPNNVIIPSISLFGFGGGEELDVLVGMNIISLGDFLVSTRDELLHFSFQMPSVGGLYLDNIYKAKLVDGTMVLGDETVRRTGKKIGPNEPCPCGSGKKYKKCHGKNS